MNNWWKSNRLKVGSVLLDFTGLVIVVIIVWLLYIVAVTSGDPKSVNNLLSLFNNWPLATILFGVVFLVPLYRLLSGLATKLSSASKIKIGDIEIYSDTVIDIILEREKLRAGVYIALVDDKPDPTELRYLHSIESEMPDRLGDLPKSGHIEVLQSTIRVSLADKEFHPKEYKALKFLASEFDISKDELDELIVKFVIEKCVFGINIDVNVPELKDQVDQAKVLRDIV